MLTLNQKKYLQTIPEDKVAVIKPFDPKIQETAQGIIKQIKNEVLDLEVFFGGASALGIAGQNDIDLNLLSTPEKYEKYIPILIKLFGQSTKASPTLVKWEFERNGFEVELYLTDRNSPALQEQIKTFELLRNNPNLLKEYEQIKLACNGFPFREYMRRKYEFFNKILYQTQPTKYPEINDLLNDLLFRIQKVFGQKLVGFYLYGSLVWGGFDYDISDIDLLAALETDIDDKEFDELEKMHVDFIKKYKEWDDRIEVQYFSKSGLKTFKSTPSKMANISPGKPLHIVEAGKEWLMNWYSVQAYGVTLFGPPPATIIEPISKEEFVQAVKEHALEWRKYVLATKKSRGYQAYAILTLCRALYTLKNGEQVSKQKAAAWAKQQLPQWAELIDNALAWRVAKIKQGEKEINNETTFPETQRFVNFAVEKVENKSG